MLPQNAEVERDAGDREPDGASPALRTAVGLSPDSSPTAEQGSGLLCPPDREAARSPLPPTAAYYAEGFGWPVSANTDGIVVRCGDVVDALVMPSGLGAEVSHLLRLHILPAPVVEVDQTGRRWIFLCEPRKASQRMPSLAHHGVEHWSDGAEVRLPSSVNWNGGPPRWISRPDLGTSCLLPPLMAVVLCVRKALQL